MSAMIVVLGAVLTGLIGFMVWIVAHDDDSKSTRAWKFGLPGVFLGLIVWLFAYCQQDGTVTKVHYYPITNVEMGDGTTVSVAPYWKDLNPKIKGRGTKDHWKNIKLLNINEELQINLENPEDHLLRARAIKRGPYVGLYMDYQKILIDVVRKSDLEKIEPNQ